MKVVLASNNAGKIKEISLLLKNFDIELIPQKELAVPEIEETANTFVENALIKARHAARVTGLPALADDSGLSIPYLNGRPGVYSARFAGNNSSDQENINKLLNELKNVEKKQRLGYFHCIIAFMLHDQDPTPLITEGKWAGTILSQKKGNDGFGYDPVFYIPALKKTAAQLPTSVKNKLSHRGIALRKLKKSIPEKICLHYPSKT